MDLLPLAVEPPGLQVAGWLLLIGLVGYFIVRRWPSGFLPFIALAMGCSLELVRRELPLVLTLRHATWRWIIAGEFAMCAAMIAIGCGLPLLARRATRAPRISPGT